MEKAAKAYAVTEDAVATLKRTASDSNANLIVGKYLCLTKGDWGRGLPMLVLGDNAKLQSLAKRDIKGARTPEEQVELGDAWWESSGKQRAAYWYERAMPWLTELGRERVEKRLRVVSFGRYINILCRVDPTRDCVAGNWMKNGMTIANTTHGSHLMLPMQIRGEYDLLASFTRQGGDDTIALIFPVGLHMCSLILSGWEGAAGGLDIIDGRGADANPTTKRPSKLINGHRYTVLVKVRLRDELASIEATLDNLPFIHWQGRQASLSIRYGIPAEHVGFAAAQSLVAVQFIQVRMISGQLAYMDVIAPLECKEVAGKWTLTYNNGFVRHYKIDVAGHVTFVEEGSRSQLVRQGMDILLDLHDGKLERIKIIGPSRLQIEHFNPAGNFPAQISCTANGVREDAN